MSFHISVVIISLIVATIIHKKLNLDYNFFMKEFDFKKIIVSILSFLIIVFVLCIPLELLYESLIG